MSRSGYSDDLDTLDLGRWRGQVSSAINGKRGQQMLSDLIAALDAMPVKRLIKGDLDDEHGEVCALGAVGRHRGVDLDTVDTYDYDGLGAALNIAHQLAQEVMFENDDCGHWQETPEQRWVRIRNWAVRNLRFAQKTSDG